jgi:pyruvate dehydrogenase E1 component alpha subunit
MTLASTEAGQHVAHEEAPAVFYFDLGSPYAYLAAERINKVMPEPVVWQPILLGGIWKAKGGHSWATTDRRQEGMAEIEARAERYGLQPVKWPEGWPNNTLQAMRAAIFAQQIGRAEAFALAAFRQAFAGGKDLSDIDNILIAAAACELHPKAVLKGIETEAVKDGLKEATQEALERGVWGVPTIAVGNRLFWGDDRLEEAAHAVAARAERRKAGFALQPRDQRVQSDEVAAEDATQDATQDAAQGATDETTREGPKEDAPQEAAKDEQPSAEESTAEEPKAEAVEEGSQRDAPTADEPKAEAAEDDPQGEAATAEEPKDEEATAETEETAQQDEPTADTEEADHIRSPEETGVKERQHELPDAETCRLILHKMMLIRRFEERAGEMYAKAKIGGFLHLCIGEEATIVGATQALRDTDYLMSTYREHGQALARGTEPEAVMAELFGKVDGVSGGRGGSMHLFDWDRRFLGGYGIVGGSLPLSAGVALACDYEGTEDIILSMTGDGATNQGTFGETMNLVALWDLPVVFLIINNQFGMGTALERHSAVTDLSKKAEGFGVPGTRCDGMNVLDVHKCVAEACRKAREDRKPQLVEAVTYRYRGHSMADPEEYRTKDEVEEWRKRDPIETFSKRVIDEDVLSEDDIKKIDEEAIAKVDESVKHADDSPFPDLDSLYDDIYVLEGDRAPAWWSVDERTPEVHRGEEEREAGELPHELAEKGAAYAAVGEQKSRHKRGEGGAEESSEGEGEPAGDEREEEGGAD